MKLKKEQVTIDNMIINYYTAGKGDPLLFIHGAGVDALVYKADIEQLAKSFFVIAPDIPGFGLSSSPKKNWTFSDFADLFSKFIDSLHISELFLVSQSFGGGIAYMLAATNKKIKKLVLVDSAVLPITRSSFLQTYNFIAKKSINTIRIYRNTEDFIQIFTGFWKNNLRNIFRLRHVYKTVIQCVKKGVDLTKKVTIPTLILWGETDELFPLTSGYAIQKHIARSELRVIPGNHDWSLMQAEKFGKIISGYLL